MTMCCDTRSWSVFFGGSKMTDSISTPKVVFGILATWLPFVCVCWGYPLCLSRWIFNTWVESLPCIPTAVAVCSRNDTAVGTFLKNLESLRKAEYVTAILWFIFMVDMKLWAALNTGGVSSKLVWRNKRACAEECPGSPCLWICWRNANRSTGNSQGTAELSTNAICVYTLCVWMLGDANSAGCSFAAVAASSSLHFQHFVTKRVAFWRVQRRCTLDYRAASLCVYP